MNRLREIRVVKRVTQFQLRMQTGIHQGKISLIENGLVTPRDDEKKRLAKALGVRPDEIWQERPKHREAEGKRGGLTLLTLGQLKGQT